MSRVFQRCGWWWIDFVDAQHLRHRKRVSPTKRVAMEVLTDTLNRVVREEFLGIVAEPAINFADFAKLWGERVLRTLAPGTAKRWQGIVRNYLRPAFKGTLREIDRGRVERYVNTRLEAGANPASINREVAVLRHILRRACQWKHETSGAPYLKHYPLQEWKPLREPAGRTRFLSEEDIERLLNACSDSRSPHLRAFVLVALNSGMRRSEILSLSRSSVDWHNRIATLTQTKNGESRHVHLNQTAIDALRSLPVPLDREGRLFPFKDQHSVSRSFRRAVKRASIEDFRLHDLRHCFASYQAMAGIQARGLQTLLGHRDPRMTTRYSHLSDAYLKAAVDTVQLGGSADVAKRHKAGGGIGV